MRTKLIFCFGLLVCFLFGCEERVVTVANIDAEGSESPGYIEIRELELKETESSGGEVDGIRHCMVAIPEGYVESEEIPGMYIHEKSPLDSSNVYYTVSPLEDQVADYMNLTADSYEQAIEEAYQKSGMEEFDLAVTSFEKQQLEGFPSYMIRTVFGEGDGRIEQLVYLIISDQIYTITYSQAAGDELLADFQVSEGKISLIRK